jgi:hypothetical protein
MVVGLSLPPLFFLIHGGLEEDFATKKIKSLRRKRRKRRNHTRATCSNYDDLQLLLLLKGYHLMTIVLIHAAYY